MTLEMIYDGLINKKITPKDANDFLQNKENKKIINSYIHRGIFTSSQMESSELSKLMALVNCLQIIYNSGVESCVSDYDYDILQELLVNEGIPRLTGSISLSDNEKVNHSFTQIRGTLDKVYYLTQDEKRINPSRKYLDEWIKSTERLYEKKTGNKIDLNNEKVLVTPKFDGHSVELNIIDGKFTWMTRGDTDRNEADDLTYIMKQFNDVYSNYAKNNCGLKFEVMVSEKAKDDINEILTDENYKSSRSVVSSIFNCKEPDFRVKYLHPILLRVINEGEEIETIPSELINGYPSIICNLSERDKIREFGNQNKFVIHNNHKFRTDGVVLTLINSELQKILGRDRNINNFEVAYKHTEEFKYSNVKDIEFYISEFGYITPVVVIEPVKMKGNTIDHISLSNKERFDELKLCKGDMVKVLYDIIPYVTLDGNCIRSGKKRIEFTRYCPSCGNELLLNVIQVKCDNDKCESKILGRISNYCSRLNMKNIGYKSLKKLYDEGLIKNIRSLYKLKNKTLDIETIDGFGKLKTKKFIKEIELKRKIKDYEFFGAYGIEGLSMTSFETIFKNIPYHEFYDMILNKDKFNELSEKLNKINGFGEEKIKLIINHFKIKDNRKNIDKLIDELTIIETYSVDDKNKPILVISGFRDQKSIEFYENLGYKVTTNWTNKASALIVPDLEYKSSKVDKANQHNIPILINGASIPF